MYARERLALYSRRTPIILLTEEIDDTSGVTPLVVVPGDELDEVVVEGDTSLGIEDGRVAVTVQVSGDKVIL